MTTGVKDPVRESLSHFNPERHFLTSDLQVVSKNIKNRILRLFCPKKFKLTNVALALCKKVDSIGLNNLRNYKGFTDFLKKLQNHRGYVPAKTSFGRRSYLVLNDAGIASTILEKLSAIHSRYFDRSKEVRAKEFASARTHPGGVPTFKKEAVSAYLDVLAAAYVMEKGTTKARLFRSLKAELGMALIGYYIDSEEAASKLAQKMFDQVTYLAQLEDYASQFPGELDFRAAYQNLTASGKTSQSYEAFKNDLCLPLQCYVRCRESKEVRYSRTPSPHLVGGGSGSSNTQYSNTFSGRRQ